MASFFLIIYSIGFIGGVYMYVYVYMFGYGGVVWDDVFLYIYIR